MKITFYSNYLTHHQIPFCNEMYKLLDRDYTFVSTKPMDSERCNMGWTLTKQYPYELKAYQNNSNLSKAFQLAEESDVIIIGSAPEDFVLKRMKKNHTGITFRYSERIYKRGKWRVISPRGIFSRFHTYFRYINRPLYMLCASGYTAGDLSILGSYINRCYKWGYFPQVRRHEIDSLIEKKRTGIPKVLWTGRFIDLKHPEHALAAAQSLVDQEIDFKLKMIGDGEMLEKIKNMANNMDLKHFVEFPGAMTPDEVRTQMEEANIYLFTSDFKEGWGAVLNEAMNSGCAVVASHAIGSVPFLLKHGENGLIYKNGDLEDLCSKVKSLVLNQEERERLGRNAYDTIFSEWNVETAAERFIILCRKLYWGKNHVYESGPCSKAPLIGNSWFKDA